MCHGVNSRTCPHRRQVAPTSPASSTSTSCPADEAANAASRPMGPAPITATRMVASAAGGVTRRRKGYSAPEDEAYMKVLAIETSCDETAASVVDASGVRSDVVYTQDVHAAFGGVVPELAS